MTELTGKLLKDRYRVEAYLGRGGMAEVYKAWDTRRSYPVAIKLMHADLAEDVEFERRFRREAESLATLAHENIVRFYEFQREGHRLFLVMDYVDGITLRRRIFDTQGRLPPDEFHAVGWQVSAALHYAHEEGIIHRDVKPGNIMIRPDGRVLVADFGIAKATDASTITTYMPGTPAYMSPEQCRAEPGDRRSDVYSLGVVLYEMLTGVRPFVGESQASGTSSTREKIRWEQLHAEPPSLRAINPAVSPGLEAVIFKAMSKKPDYRYPTTLALWEAVQQAAGQEAPVRATPPPKPAPQPSPPPQRVEVWPVSAPLAPKGRLSRLRPGGWVMIGVILLTAALLLGMVGRSYIAGQQVAAVTATAVTNVTVQAMVVATREAEAAATAQAGVTATAETIATVTAHTVQSRATVTAQAIDRATVQAAATSTAQTGAETTATAQTKATTWARATTIRVTATAQARATATAKVRRPTVAAQARARITVTAQARATATARAGLPNSILFQDDFSTNANDWWTGTDSDYYLDEVTKITNGKYRMSITSKRGVITRNSVPDFLARDFLLSVDATLVETSAATGDAAVSIVFRKIKNGDNWDYYKAQFQTDGDCFVEMRRNGEWHTLQEPFYTDAIKLEPGVTNNFAVLVKGSAFTVYANGQQLTTVTDATLSEKGEATLAVSLFEPNETLTVDFDNLVIKTPPADAPSAQAAPATAPPPAPTETPSNAAIPAGKGMLMYYNHTSMDFVIDVIGPTADSAVIPPNSHHEFILDPGQYQYNGHTPGGQYHVVNESGFEIVAGKIKEFHLR